MKTNHTPGPWRIGDAGHTVFGLPNGNPSPKTIATNLSRANARLIAAAPELLEAAKAAHKWGMLKNNMDTLPWLETLESAIDKAEGGIK